MFQTLLHITSDLWLGGNFSKMKYGLRFKSAGMWHCVLEQVVPKVLKEHDALIFPTPAVQEDTESAWPWRWRHYK